MMQALWPILRKGGSWAMNALLIAMLGEQAYTMSKGLLKSDLTLTPEEKQAGEQKRAMASLADVMTARESVPKFTESNAVDDQYTRFLLSRLTHGDEGYGADTDPQQELLSALSEQIGEPVTRQRIQNTLSRGSRPVDPRLALYRGFTTGA